MKKILFITLAFVLITSKRVGAISVETISKKEAPYEIQSITFNEKYLEIKGWAFLSETQHFNNVSDHDYQLLMLSKSDKIEINSDKFVKYNLSQTELMKYDSSKMCSLNQYNQKSTKCNYYYENIGFSIKVPIEMLKTNEEYRIFLRIIAKNSKKSGYVDIYFPIETPISKEINGYLYTATSNLTAVSLKVLDYENLRVRLGPGKEFLQATGGNYCNIIYKNYLYHLKDTVYTKVYKERLNGLNTWYQVSGKLGNCYSGRRRVVNGDSLRNLWIVSNFVEYQGKPLIIKKMPLASRKIIRFIDKKVINDNYSNDLWNNKLDIIRLILANRDHLISEFVN